MGRDARRNPLSTEGTVTEEDFALARMAQLMAEIPDRLTFERWLLGFPAETRLDVRRQMQPFCRFTVEARRAMRQQLGETARLVAGVGR